MSACSHVASRSAPRRRPAAWRRRWAARRTRCGTRGRNPRHCAFGLRACGAPELWAAARLFRRITERGAASRSASASASAGSSVWSYFEVCGTSITPAPSKSSPRHSASMHAAAQLSMNRATAAAARRRRGARRRPRARRRRRRRGANPGSRPGRRPGARRTCLREEVARCARRRRDRPRPVWISCMGFSTHSSAVVSHTSRRALRAFLGALLAPRARWSSRARGEPRWRARALGPRTRRSRSTTSSSSFACLFFQPFHGSLARGGFRDERFGGDVGSRRRVSVGAWANEGLGSVSGGGGVCVPGARVVVRNPRRILQPRPCRHPTILILNPFLSTPHGKGRLRKLTTEQIPWVQHSIYV